MSVMQQLVVGDVLQTLAAERQRELLASANKARRDALAYKHSLEAARAVIGAAVIRAGRWIGGAQATPRAAGPATA